MFEIEGQSALFPSKRFSERVHMLAVNPPSRTVVGQDTDPVKHHEQRSD